MSTQYLINATLPHPSRSKKSRDKGRPCDYLMKNSGTQSHLCTQYHVTPDMIRELGSEIRDARTVEDDYSDSYERMDESVIREIGGYVCLMSKRMGKEATWQHLLSIEGDRYNRDGAYHTVKSAFQNTESNKIALITSYHPTNLSLTTGSGWGSPVIYNTKMHAPLLFWETLYKKIVVEEEPVNRPVPLPTRILLIQNILGFHPTSTTISGKVEELCSQCGIEERSSPQLMNDIQKLEHLCGIN
jgi:hypothetical protein